MANVLARLKKAEEKLNDVLAKEASRAASNGGLPPLPPGRTFYESFIRLGLVIRKRLKSADDMRRQFQDFMLLSGLMKLIPYHGQCCRSEFELSVRDDPAVKRVANSLIRFVLVKNVEVMKFCLAQRMDVPSFEKWIAAADSDDLIAAGFPSLAD